MCGIVSYIGKQDAVPLLIDCLKRLEYRGYDSAGIGVMHNGSLEVRRSVGKIADLEHLLRRQPLQGHIGIAHTRWATHGKPSDGNAHPHSDCSGSLVVVHNGIIENYLSLKSGLQAAGHRFRSETDTEVVAHLLEEYWEEDWETAVCRALSRLKGAYALSIMTRWVPDTLIAARNGGPPLIIGLAGDELFLASDIPALLKHTRDVLILEDGEMAVLSPEGVRIRTLDGRPVQRQSIQVEWDAEAAEKGGYPHFMLKEIYEQPRAIADTLRGRIDIDTGTVLLPELRLTPEELRCIERIAIVACGTSWHAGLVGEHLLETLSRLPVEVEISSEFRYRQPLLGETTLVVVISQSGETADTLGALKEAHGQGSPVLAICNVVGSSIAREADGVIYTRAGPEIGVASTKAFTTQIVALYLLAVHLGRIRGTISAQQAVVLLKDLSELPPHVEDVLTRDAQMKEWAQQFYRYTNFLYLGRGINYPLALEGALKLKEISYIHAEGYPAGEMKHGPIALIDQQMPVVVLAPQDRWYEKILGNIEEVRARDGTVIALASAGDEEIATKVEHVCYLSRTSELLVPVLSAIPLQLLAYHIAVLRDCDVDQPRNLAK
ncbi:MAG: glutamine--fructose-6-phosphate transaminase (isomerizing), partial [Nitrospinota bacterium]